MARPRRSAAKIGSVKMKELLEPSESEVAGDMENLSSTSDDSDFTHETAGESTDGDLDYNHEGNDHQGNGNLVEFKDQNESLVVASDAEDKIQVSTPARKKRLITNGGNKPARKRTKSRGGKQAVDPENKLEWQVWEEETAKSLGGEKRLLQTVEPPPELLMSLLPFQKEFLWWSLRQEASETRGGILADEMGMGKTIQAISLILTSRAQNSSPLNTSFMNETFCEMSSSATPAAERPQVKATLVVCPLVAVIQWRNEISRFTKEGTVKVLTYHGTKRCKDVEELAKYDIVLTTYAIVELEHRRKVMPAKQPCKWCGKLFYPDRMRVHLRFFCGPHAKKTEKQAKQLKKAPRTSKSKLGKSLGKDTTDCDDLEQKSKVFPKGPDSDEGEQSTKLKPKKSGWGRGRKKIIEAEDLDGAITEAMDELNGANSKGVSVLHAVKWNRIILDEAHCIKDRKCSTAKAVFALGSSFKWALSGTPLQNRVGELYSLVRFLEIKPYSYYFCKNCECKALDYSFGVDWRKCNSCDHSPLVHFCWWNKFVANPIKKWGFKGDGLKAMTLLKDKLLHSILLRRTKEERAADLALPPSMKCLRRDSFDSREDDFYQALYTQSQSQFNTYIDSGTLLNNYAHIFDLLTRLRQAVDHPYLVVYSRTASGVTQQYAAPADTVPVNDLCSICSDPLEEPVTSSCNHTFCKACIQEYVSAAIQTPACPVCQNALTIDFTGSTSKSETDAGPVLNRYKRSSILSRIDLSQFQTSTKIDALREEIDEMLERDCTSKAIVFSQFTSFLELIGFRLDKFGIKCVKLDGSMSITARDKMIEKFTNDPEIKVFLMSIKAGGVALNLTVASHVFLMDPWWNPAVEQQAQDRIHRLGQYKPIRVVRFVIENTIEERILKLQEKKQLVFEGTVGGSAEALGRLTEHDLCFLFTC